MAAEGFWRRAKNLETLESFRTWLGQMGRYGDAGRGPKIHKPSKTHAQRCVLVAMHLQIMKLMEPFLIR
eukprot:9503817-Pyramimonas_sp.AAC.2